MMKLFVVKPVTYYDGENDVDWMRLADLAKISGESPEKVWENWGFVLAVVEGDADLDDILVNPVPRVLIASVKMEEKFYMDLYGNVVDDNGQRTGLRVNGPADQSVGDWEDIYVPIDWAERTLRHIWEGGFGKNMTREQLYSE
jgi:hypothetical protein